MPPFRAILFDAGGTLVHPNRAEILRAFRRHGFEPGLARLDAAELKTRARLDTPKVVRSTTDASRWDEYYGGILHELGIPRTVLEDLRAYHDRRNLWDTVPPEVPAVLERLARRFRLGVVSNSNGTVARVLAELRLAHFFEIIVDSSVVGVEKPDPRIFQIALSRMKLGPHEALYVGDLYHVDVLGARGAGIEGLLLDPGGIHGDKDGRRIRSLSEIESKILADSA